MYWNRFLATTTTNTATQSSTDQDEVEKAHLCVLGAHGQGFTALLQRPVDRNQAATSLPLNASPSSPNAFSTTLSLESKDPGLSKGLNGHTTHRTAQSSDEQTSSSDIYASSPSSPSSSSNSSTSSFPSSPASATTPNPVRIRIPSGVSTKVFSEFLRYLYTFEATMTPENRDGLLICATKFKVID